MKFWQIIFLSILLCISAGCDTEMTGTVVDAETGQPIEGAVVLVEWTVTKGLPGMRSTERYKVVEGMSNRSGKIILELISDLFVNQPRVTIYKKGYVAWNSDYTFPDWKKRDHFQWVDGITIRLEPFEAGYTRSDHVYFLHNVTHWGKKMNEAFRWEELELEKENKR